MALLDAYMDSATEKGIPGIYIYILFLASSPTKYLMILLPFITFLPAPNC